jgi:small subunit ribosomal protein S1
VIVLDRFLSLIGGEQAGMSDANKALEELLNAADKLPMPRRGDLLTGTIIAIDQMGMIVDLGLKRDGVVTREDLDKLSQDEGKFKLGDDVAVLVMDPHDRDGNLLVSLAQARESSDWIEANQLLESDEIFEAEPIDFNRGGLIVPFGRLRGFVPASHVSDLPRGLDEDERQEHLAAYVGQSMPFKIIEVDPQRRRLVLSERKAIRQWRQLQKADLIESLKEGQVVEGTVTSLREFGAFVDIGGADGLIHISEMSWDRVEDPSDLLEVGQEIEVLILRLDEKSNRIGLSMKRLLPNPWEEAKDLVKVGQDFDGCVSCLSSKGVFVKVDHGLEGLLQLENGPGSLDTGVQLHVRVTNFEPDRERLDLELIE